MTYRCRNCNFRFEASKLTDCPYCGKRTGVEKEKNATELLDEVDSLLNE